MTLDLRVEVVQPSQALVPGSTEDKVADWAAAVVQLRDIAKWVVGGVVAMIVAVFATSAFARLGQMDLAADRNRLIAAGVGFALAVLSVGLIFRFGVRVIVPSGTSLQRLEKAQQHWSSDARARRFLFRLNGLDEREFSLADLLANKDDPDYAPWVEQFRRTLSFAVVKTRFDNLMIALVIALLLAVPAMLVFVWAANPPEGHGKPAVATHTVTYDAAGAVTQRQVTLEGPPPAPAN